MEDRNRLSTFMCHDTSTADRFYVLTLDATEARRIRGLFEQSMAPSTAMDEWDSSAGLSQERMEATPTKFRMRPMVSLSPLLPPVKHFQPK